MNFIDILLALIILLSVWNGISKGFFTGLGGLVSWLGSLLITFWVYRYIAVFVEKHIVSSMWTAPLAFLMILLITGMMLAFMVNKILVDIPHSVDNHIMNKLFGFLPGLVAGLLYAAILSGLLLLLPLSGRLTSTVRDSSVAQALILPLEKLEYRLAPLVDPAISRTLNGMTIEPESTEHVVLPFSVENAPPRPDLEKEMLQYINDERIRHGIPPLAHDTELVPVARQHSEDMFARAYFSHISPEGDTPFDRLRKAGVSFLAAGENLAIAQTLSLAHEGLMKSPGHRANILRQTFGRIGIGILDGGVHGFMITQKFRN